MTPVPSSHPSIELDYSCLKDLPRTIAACRDWKFRYGTIDPDKFPPKHRQHFKDIVSHVNAFVKSDDIRRQREIDNTRIMRERLADQKELLRQRAIARKAKETEDRERQESDGSMADSKRTIIS